MQAMCRTLHEGLTVQAEEDDLCRTPRATAASWRSPVCCPW